MPATDRPGVDRSASPPNSGSDAHTRQPPDTGIAPDERDRLMAALHEIAKMSLASLELDEILDAAAHQIVSAGIFRSLMIAMVDHDAQRVEVVRNFLSFEDGIMRAGKIKPGGVLLHIDHVRHKVPDQEVRKDQRIVGTAYALDDDNITAQVARTGEMEIVQGPSKNFDLRVTDLSALREGHVSYFIPVNHRGRCVAVLATGSQSDEMDEVMRRIEAMGPLIDQFAIALEHAALFQEIRDSHKQLERVNVRLQEEIDERRRIDEQLRQSHKMQALGQLTAGVAHNFNNHLMAILGNLECLEMTGIADESLELAQSAGLRAADMVKQLMLFSRVESRGVPRPVHLVDVLNDAIAIGRKTFDRSIVFDDRLTDDLPTVSGDAGQLEQLFLNLLLNARGY